MKLSLGKNNFAFLILVLNLIWLMLFALGKAEAAEKVSLEKYLSQVKKQHLGYKAATLAAAGAEDHAEKGRLLVFPTAFADFSHATDKKLTTNPQFQGTGTTYNQYSLGIKYLSPIGFSSRLYYSLQYTEISGANPLFLPQNHYHESRPTLEMNIPLWRNLFGTITRAEQTELEAQALSQQYEQSFYLKQLQAQAEVAYWKLALAKDTVEVQKESLDRAQKLQQWSERRAKLGLSDKADLLQATAALELRQLELKMAKDDLRAALQGFNSLRGVNSSDDTIQPDSLEKLNFANIHPPQKPKEDREDIRAAEQKSRLQSAELTKELNTLTPDIQVYGAYGLNGRADERGSSWAESWNSNRPYWLVGLKIEAPLDVPLILKSRRGHQAELEATEYQLDRKRFDVDQEWIDLNKKFQESKSRLDLAKSIESIQKEKLLYEKSRHAKGRTTTYQVLMFEQDFSTSQLNRIRVQAEILSTLAQMKTFGEKI